MNLRACRENLLDTNQAHAIRQRDAVHLSMRNATAQPPNQTGSYGW